MRFRVSHLIAAVVAAAIVSFATAYAITASSPVSWLRIALGLGCFAVFAELLEYRMPRGGHGSAALVPILAIILVAPSWHGVAVVGLCEIIHQLIRRRKLEKAVFNCAQAVLSTSIATVLYRSLDGHSFAEPGGFRTLVVDNALPTLACLFTAALVNSLAVNAAIALSANRRFLEVWGQNSLGTLVYSFIAWPLAGGLAWVYAKNGFVFAAAFAIPFLGVRQLYRATLKLQETNRELLELMVKAIEARDPYTSGHSRRVADSAVVIARSLSLSTAEVERVRIAALLHDIGKIHEDFAPILRKEGPLTRDEWAVMKTHSEKGAELISTLSDLQDLVGPVRHHHENWDGTGYPAGIAGEQIPLASRIITFADTIDALTTDRPYRSARTAEQVRAELVRCRGAQFDPRICDAVLGHSVWSQLFPSMVAGEGRVTTPQRVKLVRTG